MKCKACLSDDLLKKESTKDGEILKCKQCGSKYINLRHANINKNLEYGEAYRNNLSEQKAISLYKIFSGHVINKKKNVLDIGCGSGDFIKLVQREGWCAAGIDSDLEAVKLLQSQGINSVHGILGEQITSLNEMYDVITLWDLIEHVDNVEYSVEWISDHLKKDGQIIVITPDANSLLDHFARIESTISLGKSKMLLEICLNQYHLNRFSEKGLILLFKRYGIAVEKTSRVNLFSLKPETYFNSFAPEINKLTNYSMVNKLLSKSGIYSTKLFGIKNKLLFVGKKIE
jgi:2-polyprenyl-3-methyl-5-hydroxy-6-metoxy-1,4-benzoquinol methylase